MAFFKLMGFLYISFIEDGWSYYIKIDLAMLSLEEERDRDVTTVSSSDESLFIHTLPICLLLLSLIYASTFNSLSDLVDSIYL